MRISKHLFGTLVLCLSACSCGDSAGSTPQPVRPGDVNAGFETASKKCMLCHSFNGRGGNLAPAMDEQVKKVLEQIADYPARAAAFKAADPKAYKRSEAIVERLIAEADPRKRFELWISTYLADPKFDNPQSRMASVNMSPQEIADVLVWLWALRGAH
jgi:cytochrome c2